jgi:hypothetical protein
VPKLHDFASFLPAVNKIYTNIIEIEQEEFFSVRQQKSVQSANNKKEEKTRKAYDDKWKECTRWNTQKRAYRSDDINKHRAESESVS